MCMRTILLGWTVALAVVSACAAQPEVRAIDVRGLDLGEASGWSVQAPMLFTNIDELFNTVADEQAMVAICAQVDFSKENVLYFRWEGSGQDTLTTKIAARSLSREVTFAFTPGMTLELSAHHHLFAIPKHVSWRVEVIMPGPGPIQRVLGEAGGPRLSRNVARGMRGRLEGPAPQHGRGDRPTQCDVFCGTLAL